MDTPTTVGVLLVLVVLADLATRLSRAGHDRYRASRRAGNGAVARGDVPLQGGADDAFLSDECVLVLIDRGRGEGMQAGARDDALDRELIGSWT